MDYRIEHDSMGEVRVPADKYWAAQTERCHENFPIGVGLETMPREITHAFGILKKAAAHGQPRPQAREDDRREAGRVISAGLRRGDLRRAQRALPPGGLADRLRHPVQYERQRGHRQPGQRAGRQAKLLHPNDDINMCQSSNDTFPTAMHIAAAVRRWRAGSLPAMEGLVETFRRLESGDRAAWSRAGRTHLQDAVPPSRFSQEVCGWRVQSLERDRELLVLRPAAAEGAGPGRHRRGHRPQRPQGL